MTGADNKTHQVIAQIWELVEPVILSEGMELIEVEYRQESRGRVLRLFIDQEDGITVDDCARVSQVVGDLLDVADPIDAAYNLEVSSPGLDRPLRKWTHFHEHVGKVIEVKTVIPIQNRRNFKGVLMEATPEEITIDCQGHVFKIALSMVERARLRYFDSLDE